MKSLMTDLEDLALAALVYSLPSDGKILELGTGIGGSARIMLQAREDVTLVTVDNLSLRRPRLRDELRKLSLPPMTQDALIEKALEPYRSRVERYTSVDAIPAGEFDLVLIDGAHDYESVVRDNDALIGRVEPEGGILAFHDYGNAAGGGGVARAVTEWRALRYWPERWRELLHVETLIAFTSA